MTLSGPVLSQTPRALKTIIIFLYKCSQLPSNLSSKKQELTYSCFNLLYTVFFDILYSLHTPSIPIRLTSFFNCPLVELHFGSLPTFDFFIIFFFIKSKLYSHIKLYTKSQKIPFHTIYQLHQIMVLIFHNLFCSFISLKR